MQSTSSDSATLRRPPFALLASALLIFLSLFDAGAEWWSDHRGFDWTIATLFAPQVRHPAWDLPVKADGSVLTNPAEASQYEAAREADARRYEAFMTRKATSVVMIGVMFIAGFGCGLVAWNRMVGRRWSRGAALLCVVCRNTFAFVMFLICAGFAIADDFAPFLLLATLSCIGLAVASTVYVYTRLYRALREPPGDVGPETSLPTSWLVILAATFITSTALLVGADRWLTGKQQEQRVEADRQSEESAAIAKTFADDALKSGAAKYPDRKAWKQDHPFDRRFD